MVLAVSIGELRLQKKIAPLNNSSAIRSRQTLTYTGFKIMSALVGSVDPAKTRTDGKFSKLRRAFFFPGGAIKEAGQRRGLG